MQNERIENAPTLAYWLTRAGSRGIMVKMGSDECAPDLQQLTSYDEGHLADYLRLLDANADGTDWREAAGLIFGIDAAVEPDRAKTMHDTHLARARWITEVGYAHLLGCQPR